MIRAATLVYIKPTPLLGCVSFGADMFRIVKDYVVSCAECQKRKFGPHKSTGLYQPIPIANRLFETFSIDLLGPIPESDGYKYCFCMVDQLSHMLLIEPLRETSGDTILVVMKNRVFLKFGFPLRIIADRGLNLTARFAYDYYEKFGITLTRTSSFHPQTNGMVESLNRLIGHSLAIFWSSQREWHKYCPLVEFCYNTTTNITTGLSPFFVAYGQEARLPAEAITGRLNLAECPEPGGSASKAIDFADRLATARRAARDNYLKAQEKRQPIIDANRTHVEFLPGEEVLVYQNHRKISAGGKFKPRYTGPWIVLQKYSPKTYLVTMKEKRGKGGLRFDDDLVNVCRMKRCVSRPEPLITKNNSPKDVIDRQTIETNVECEANRNTVVSDRNEANRQFDEYEANSAPDGVSGDDDRPIYEPPVDSGQRLSVGSEPPYTELIARAPPPPVRERPTRRVRPPEKFKDFARF